MAVSPPGPLSRRLMTPGWPVTLLVLAGVVVSLYFTALALQRGSEVEELLFPLLLVDLLVLLVLVAAVITNVARLMGERHREAMGAQLTTRLLLMFVTLALVPAGVLFFFSFQFIQRGVDSWFHVEVERALDEALGMARYQLDQRRQNLVAEARELASELQSRSRMPTQLVLPDLRRDAGLDQVALFAANGNLLGSSSSRPTANLPQAPPRSELLQVTSGTPLSLVIPKEGLGPWRIRAYVPVERLGGGTQVLRVAEKVPAAVAERSRAIQAAFEDYRRLQVERGPLKTSFLLTLTLVLVLTLFVAVWLAFQLADRFTAPIRQLAQGTRAVARGEYGHQIRVPSQDELGVLVRSFNAMTRRLAAAQEEVRTSHAEAQARRAYLETILDSLASGVVTLDQAGRVDTVNPAARTILGLPAGELPGASLGVLARDYPQLRPLLDLYLRSRSDPRPMGPEQRELSDPHRGTVTLLLRGAPLLANDRGGFVLVFDDVTELLRAQRASAWSEVARRMAHEIKNPLTPIQLSAERLRRRYLSRLGEEEGEPLRRATATIVQQVESLRDMVDAFSAYARQPGTRPAPGDINALVSETVGLYRSEGSPEVTSELAADLPPVMLDPSRMGQVLGNLIQNAAAALEGREDGHLWVRTYCADSACRIVAVEVADNGPGFPAELLDRIFDPYITTKEHGSGLGLAIARKIAEDHGGRIHAANGASGGARVVVELPAASDSMASLPLEEGDADG